MHCASAGRSPFGSIKARRLNSLCLLSRGRECQLFAQRIEGFELPGDASLGNFGIEICQLPVTIEDANSIELQRLTVHFHSDTSLFVSYFSAWEAKIKASARRRSRQNRNLR